jgi:hypothetical protein
MDVGLHDAFRALVDHLERPPILCKPLDRVDLYIYLAVLVYVTSLAILREVSQIQESVYYVASDCQLLRETTRSWKSSGMAC